MQVGTVVNEMLSNCRSKRKRLAVDSWQWACKAGSAHRRLEIRYKTKVRYTWKSALLIRGGLCEWLKQAVLKTGLAPTLLLRINHLHHC